MGASIWEFKNRALIFGILLSLGFGFYFLDSQNVAAAFANECERRYGFSASVIVRILFFSGTVLIAIAALVRTWASAYLQMSVVYASEIKTAVLVGGGPYRFVRNPLYLANVLMAVGMGSVMSRAGFVFTILAMIAFCYRLIFSEEHELQVANAVSYAAYLQAVPRLWPSLRPRIPASGQIPNWTAGFKAEAWYWSFAWALLAFAITLQVKWFFIVVTVSVVLLMTISATTERRARTRTSV